MATSSMFPARAGRFPRRGVEVPELPLVATRGLLFHLLTTFTSDMSFTVRISSAAPAGWS